jgi:VWFA-related protein
MVRRAATSFVRTLRPQDRAAIVLFSTRVRMVQGFSDDRSRIEAALQSVMPSGSTALWEAVYISLAEMARARGDEAMRRQALVVFTDGDDNASHVSFDDVLEHARAGTVTIYAIMPPAPVRPELPKRPASALFAVKRLSETSGGRIFTPQRHDELARAYSEIEEELRHQYWLAYLRPTADEGFRRVSVRILTQPDLRARTRSGYSAAAARGGQ